MDRESGQEVLMSVIRWVVRILFGMPSGVLNNRSDEGESGSIPVCGFSKRLRYKGSERENPGESGLCILGTEKNTRHTPTRSVGDSRPLFLWIALGSWDRPHGGCFASVRTVARGIPGR